ncbi:MAG TPA: hypothetical protein VGL91_11870 [Acidobacteriota bacterium]
MQEVKGRQEAGSRRQEAGGRKQEAGSRRQEAGGRRQEAGGRRQGDRQGPQSSLMSVICHSSFWFTSS